MRPYEVVVIIRADLSDDDLATQIETIQNWITSQGGSISKTDQWGRRHLAYPIAKQRDGYYVLINAELSAAAPSELERNLRLSENILRFLITRADE